MSDPRYDEGVELVHRAFCDPVGEWDRRMAESLRERGFAIVRVEDVARRLHTYIEEMDLACIHWEERGVHHKGCVRDAKALLGIEAPASSEEDR